MVQQAPRQTVEASSLETRRPELGNGLNNLVWLRCKNWLEQRKVRVTSVGPFNLNVFANLKFSSGETEERPSVT